MRVIVLQDRPAASRSLAVSGFALWALPVLLLLCLSAAAAAGYRAAMAQVGEMPADVLAAWQAELGTLASNIDELRETSNRESRAYAARAAALQSRLLRMEAVGQRLAVAANLDQGEFDFEQEPALGGPFNADQATYSSSSELAQALDRLAQLIEDRERQFEVMERLVVNRTLAGETSLEGLPVVRGYLSSRFGRRTDPFDGRTAWHKGVDFTARPGTDVIAIAAGVVTWAGYDKDYGKLVEIRHSDGYRTRYAHNREYLVKPGEVIKKGQVIAKVGQTGRASGAHLHFEVIQDGKLVDPMQYISTVRADR
jgi:murein DD-endopeptidase MepM/ murein hydrolase activator NlpD